MTPVIVPVIGLIIALLTPVVAIAAAFAVVQYRVSTLSDRDKAFEQDLSATAIGLQAAVTSIARMSAEQAVLNKVSADTLAAVTKRLDEQQHQINECVATLRVLSEILERLEKMYDRLVEKN